MKNFSLDQFISSVPVLRLFGKNLALNAGIAFVIQDFLIPLYSNYIFQIVVGLFVFGLIAMFYWFVIFKKKSKNFAHFSFQLSKLEISFFRIKLEIACSSFLIKKREKYTT